MKLLTLFFSYERIILLRIEFNYLKYNTLYAQTYKVILNYKNKLFN